MYQFIALFLLVCNLLSILLFLEYCIVPNAHKMWYPNLYNDISFTNSDIKEVNFDKVKKTSIVICGLARDNYDDLQRNIPKIEFLGNLFKSYKVVIFENDSCDGTRELIKSWQQRNPNVILLECPVKDCKLNETVMYELGILSKSRIDKMAGFRNQYLNYVKQNCRSYDYMLVMDLDFEGSIAYDGLLHSLN